MKDSVSSRYAEALYSLLIANEYNAYQDALREIQKYFEENVEAFAYLLNANISLIDREKVVEEIAKSFNLVHLSPFIKLLLSKHRLNIFKSIQRDFNELVNEYNNVLEGIVYSVEKLSDGQIKSLSFSLEEKLKKRVELRNKIDRSLIGGVKIYINDKIYDGSIKNKLENMKTRLLGGNLND